MLRPALMPLVSILTHDRHREELAEFALWASKTSRDVLAGNLSTSQRTRMQRHLAYADEIYALTREAPAAAALRRAGDVAAGRSPTLPQDVTEGSGFAADAQHEPRSDT